MECPQTQQLANAVVQELALNVTLAALTLLLLMGVGYGMWSLFDRHRKR